MIDLNKIAQELNEASLKREKNGAFYETSEKRGSEGLLKHCAGEVIEATEAYTQLKLPYENNKGHWIGQYAERKHALGAELADVVACCLIIAAREEIDMEWTLSQCLEKNMERANGKGDKK